MTHDPSPLRLSVWVSLSLSLSHCCMSLCLSGQFWIVRVRYIIERQWRLWRVGLLSLVAFQADTAQRCRCARRKDPVLTETESTLRGSSRVTG